MKNTITGYISNNSVVPGSTLPDAPVANVVGTPITGDYRIDTLLESADFRWNADKPAGSVVEVTYSFMTVKPSYGGTDSGGDTGFQIFTEAQKQAVKDILAKLATEINISFREVADSGTSYGTLRFGDNDQNNSSGYAFMPNSSSDDMPGDVWISIPYADQMTPGTFNYATLVHEIGHAIGLKHPGNYNAGEASTPNPAGNFLGTAEDNLNYTIMSYRDAVGNESQQRDWFGMYDLLALRYLYGSKPVNTDNTTHSYTDAAGQVQALVEDGGGVDTLDLSSLTIGASVDLRDGHFSSVGKAASGVRAVNNLSIMYGSVIENVYATAGNDTVIGNSANNQIISNGGSDTIDGGNGTDTATLPGNRANYTVSSTANNWSVSGAGVTDTLTNVERVQFADAKLALDLDGNAGKTAKILGAVFGKSSVSGESYSKQYVGIGLNILDNGTSYHDLMQLALNARLGAGFSNADEVNLLYQNLVGSLPSTADLDYWTGTLTSGQTQASLAVMAANLDLNATNINLAGLAQTGIEFT